MRKIIATALLVGALGATAIAQTTEWYVVQDVKTKRCTVVDKRPTTTTHVVVTPSGTVYKTRTEAETGMKSIKVCTTN
jgi:hypothetical protein